MNTTNHPRLLARISGAFYLIITVCTLFAYMHVRSHLIDTGDMARTADNIVANVMENSLETEDGSEDRLNSAEL